MTRFRSHCRRRSTDAATEALSIPARVVSAASVWELEIKRALGRLRAPDDIATRVDSAGFERLAITFEHAQEAAALPLHHADPFDRMLVAQARLEGLTLATSDASVARYDVDVLTVPRG